MRLVKLLSRGEGIRTLLWTFIKSFQVATPPPPGKAGREATSPAPGMEGHRTPLSLWLGFLTKGRPGNKQLQPSIQGPGVAGAGSHAGLPGCVSV